MSRIIVAGAIANKAGNAGEAWVRATWVRSLTALGHDVRFVEVLEPDRATDSGGSPCAPDRSVQSHWFNDITTWFGLRGRATLVARERLRSVDLATIHRQVDEADLLVDISGHLASSGEQGADLFERFRTTLYVDLDPGYTQVWHEQGLAHARLGRHTHHASVGLRLGQLGCHVPDAGTKWLPVPPFVHLPDWPIAGEPDPDVPFTTITTWRNPYGPLEWAGTTHPGKHQSFRRYRDLPAAIPELRLEVAARFQPWDDTDRCSMARAGWLLSEPDQVCGTAAAFRQYIQGSAGEFSVAQGAYVGMRSGWLSDRTVKYLASGRPAVVEDTGLEGLLPFGEGFVTFRDLDGAAAGLRAVSAAPHAHARAARRIAERHFSGQVVLPPLLRACGVMPDD